MRDPGLTGICPIVATPFTPEGAVDYDSFRRLTRFLIACGCPGLTLFGIAGEYYKLTEEEANQLVALLVEQCLSAGIPSIVSVTQQATECAVRQAQAFQSAGADILMLLPPFFLKPAASEVFAHSLAVGRAVHIPVMLQYAPEQTGVAIAPDMLAKLYQESPNICYFKIECRPPGAYISRLLELTGGAIKIFIGNAGFQIIEGMDRGAAGCMPGCSMADVYLELERLYRAGDRTGAMRMHGLLLPMLNHIRQDVEMIIAYEKKILHKRCIIATDRCRRPTFSGDLHFNRIFDECFEGLSPYLGAASHRS